MNRRDYAHSASRAVLTILLLSICEIAHASHCKDGSAMALPPGSLDVIDTLTPPSGTPNAPYFWNSNFYSASVFFDFWGIDTYGDPAGWFTSAQEGFAGAQNTGYGLGGTKWLGVPYQYYGTDEATVTFTSHPFNYAGLLGGWDKTGSSDLPTPINGVILITDPEIQNHVDRIWPIITPSNADTIVFVMLPPNVTQLDLAGDCGWHGVTQNSHLYAVIEYPGNVPCASVPQQEAVIMHEFEESVTDPLYPLFGGNYTSWISAANETCEVSDFCNLWAFNVQSQPGVQWTVQASYSDEARAVTGDGCVYGRTTNAFLFGLGLDQKLYETPILADTTTHMTTSHSPVSWGTPGLPAGFTLAGTPGAASWGPGRLDAFVRTSPLSNTVYHANVNNGGLPLNGVAPVTWAAMPIEGGPAVQALDAVSWGAGNIQVYAVVRPAGNPVIMRNSLDMMNAGWSGWLLVSGPPGGIYPVSKVAVTSWAASASQFGKFPTDYKTVIAAFRGSDGNLWYGTSVDYAAFTWSSLGHPVANLTGDVEISVWQPGAVSNLNGVLTASIHVLDASGNVWSLNSADPKAFSSPTVTEWLGPFQGSIQVGPAAVGMGDGRVLLGGRVGGSGGASYVNLEVYGSYSGWNALPVGAYNSGVELVAW